MQVLSDLKNRLIYEPGKIKEYLEKVLANIFCTLVIFQHRKVVFVELNGSDKSPLKILCIVDYNSFRHLRRLWRREGKKSAIVFFRVPYLLAESELADNYFSDTGMLTIDNFLIFLTKIKLT